VLISDIKMPKVNGFELLEQINCIENQNPPIIIFITGGVSLEYKQKREELVHLIDGYLYKPAKDKDLLKALIHCFPRRHPKRVS
jgi:YesN/AraC family two-component response regulator